ncbi:MAG: restriction endonuclease [Candidatus Gracilibacteria bacterium]|nr:restriction endonuclease [Candidatus Gracilibacteria bacterium]
MAQKLYKVLKGNGEMQYFNSEKLFHSLKRGGATDDAANMIVTHIEGELEDGMKTFDIYHHAFELLKDKHPAVAAKYDLKRALMRLGPSGYPFEEFVAKIWEGLGYTTQVGVMVSGICIEHEVDVVAESKEDVVMMECKYHNMNATKSDVKTALYVHSRMQDLKARWEKDHPGSKKNFRGILVTNTQFSSAAIQYAECAGLEIISWDRPRDAGLKDMIDQAGLHPITSLTSLNEHHVKDLLKKGHVLCKDIKKGMKSLKLKKGQREQIEDEAAALCGLEI